MPHTVQGGRAREAHAEADDRCDEAARSPSAAPSPATNVSRAKAPSRVSPDNGTR
jgi:hypothetical protein